MDGYKSPVYDFKEQPMPNMTRVWIIFTVCAAILSACQSIQNFENPTEPLYTGNYAQPPPAFDGELKIVTWNIRFSQEIEQAIIELRTVEELENVDILLLQEMDETGVEAIAQSLGYNYVYFPASIHSEHDRNFGNAILSLWSISNPSKLLLPHTNPKNQQRRIATRAEISIGQHKVLAYSVHTETIWLFSSKRLEQIETLVADIDEDATYVVVGGDLNTVTAQNVSILDELFATVDMDRVSNGYTVQKSGLPFSVDHIYTRGMVPIASGVWPQTEASDHFPVWAIVQLDENSL